MYPQAIESTAESNSNESKNKLRAIVMIYPLVPAVLGIALNFFAFGVDSLAIALPSVACLNALAITGILLVANHTWLMTSTELVRARFNLRTTPEEWEEQGQDPSDASLEGLRELERRHNAHRNATENTVYFALLAFAFVMISPSTGAAYTWLVGYGIARLGHTYAYFSRNTALRGAFMTLSLLTMYGLASYLALSLIVG